MKCPCQMASFCAGSTSKNQMFLAMAHELVVQGRFNRGRVGCACMREGRIEERERARARARSREIERDRERSREIERDRKTEGGGGREGGREGESARARARDGPYRAE